MAVSTTGAAKTVFIVRYEADGRVLNKLFQVTPDELGSFIKTVQITLVLNGWTPQHTKNTVRFSKGNEQVELTCESLNERVSPEAIADWLSND